MATKMNREQWLTRLMTLSVPLFEKAQPGSTKHINQWRVSCGWPGGGSPRKRIGECWSDKSSAGKTVEIFISPILDKAEDVGHVLIHEMVHAAVGTEHGHKGPFVQLARAIGLEGKPTATYAGEELAKRLGTVYRKLPKYPHSALSMSTKRKKTTNHRVKLECPGCGYIVRTTNKWVDQGLPVCPCGDLFEVA